MRLTVSLICLMLCLTASAQSEKFLELGIKAGIINYQGDLQQALFTASGSRPAIGVMLRYSIGEKYTVRGALEFGNLSADDADNSNNPGLRARGYSFDANLIATEAVFEFLPLGKERQNNGIFLQQINPYLFAGLGFARANAVVSTANPADAVKFPEANDQSNFITIPFGAGVRWDVASGLAIGVEANWRPTFSDYLDGVSVNGRAEGEDWFWSAGGYVSFTFNSNKKGI